MTTYEALNEVFSKSNKELSELLQTNYYTVTTWKFQFKRNGLSMEKQFEILQKLNYNLNKSNIMEQTKRSAVTNVTANGTFNGQHGTLYKFEVSFANGDSGEYASKSQDQQKFKVGVETDYVLTERPWNGRIFYKIAPAPQQNAFQSGGFQQQKPKDPETGKHIMRMSVLKVAGDLAINGDIKLQEVLAYAQIFEQYVLTGSDTLSQFKPTTSNDLPF
jgi:hypothetical protein